MAKKKAKVAKKKKPNLMRGARAQLSKLSGISDG